MRTKIVVISSVNSYKNKIPLHNEDFTENLLLRAINRINRWIKPDVVLFTGDLCNASNDIDEKHSLRIKDIFRKIEVPLLAIPANQNKSQGFIEVFKNPTCFDIKGCRFIIFDDQKVSDFTVRRTSEDIERLISYKNFPGPIITLQSCPVFTLKNSEYPIRYDNANEIISNLKTSGVCLNISGHFDEGIDLFQKDGISFLAAPALCVAPFGFLEVYIEDDRISINKHQLKMPESLELTDCHIHTQLAYCSENMNVSDSLKLADDFGLSNLIFTEHSGHLYFDRNCIETGICYRNGIASASDDYNRFHQYIDILDNALVLSGSIGIEADIDFKGNLLLKNSDKKKFNFILGSLHCLKTTLDGNSNTNDVYNEFLTQTEQLLTKGIDVLAHPFRVLQRSGFDDYEILFSRMIALLRKYSVAVEINYHTQQPSEDFIRMCLDAGLNFSFGSDAHNLCEVGELWPHLQLFHRCGYNGNYTDILL